MGRGLRRTRRRPDLPQAGRDGAEGDEGADLLSGGRGSDCLWVLDGRGNDRAVGGRGPDRYEADPGDVLRSAEIAGCAED
jgi:Ca2+-binding RTX toxin-like protein